MIMADGGPGHCPGGEIHDVDDVDGGDNVMLDLDMLMELLGDSEDPSSKSSPEDFSFEDVKVESAAGVDNQKNFQLQNGFQMLDGSHALESQQPIETGTFFHTHNPETSDARWGSAGSFDCAGSSTMTVDDVKLEPSSQISSPMRTCSGSLRDWCLPSSRDQGVGCGTSSSVAGGEFSHATDGLDTNLQLGETGSQFRHIGGKNNTKGFPDGLCMGNLEEKFACGSALTDNSLGIPGYVNEFFETMDIPFMDADIASQNAAATQSSFCHNSDINTEYGSHYSATQYGINPDSTFFSGSSDYYFGGGFNFELLPNNVVMTNKIEVGEFQSESPCSVSEILTSDYSDVKGLNIKSEANNTLSPGNFSSSFDDSLVDDMSLGLPVSCIQSAIGNEQLDHTNYGKAGEVVACQNIMYNSDAITNEVIDGKFSCSDEYSLVDKAGPKQSSYGFSSVTIRENFFNLSCAEESKINKQWSFAKGEADGKPCQSKQLGHISSIRQESIQSNLSGSRSSLDDDCDRRILEDISQPPRTNQSLALVKPNVPHSHSAYGDSAHYSGIASTRLRTNDERFIFRAVLQDMSQPKSEASLPEGVLAIPLLRHQRIALSWMVQKETSGLNCLGGILADDQGLGKTVSTIALILKERPVPGKMEVAKKEEFETLDLDEDDDEVTEVDEMKQDVETCKRPSNQSSNRSTKFVEQSNGRPKAGTLVVCPTSVLRQWADELHKKVTRKANLSVLVYHGSNRTKDHYELTKYDVVLTTYAIVSMEVPKQAPADEDDDEKGKGEGDDVASLGFSSGKKRKYPPSSSKKGSRSKKQMDAELLESTARPLAKVSWFRVVLDEAQSIKNHRTQVARACWGLRAKRRWCLSGTPIQNAIDDLYSYFRFLKYDPYAVYTSFCSTLKIPIQRNPVKGYKKLQTVLRTIMLRRTKATKIDGKPIINLPPKVVQLKKVDFSDEERDFYTRLEAESRAQFNEYASAGTVKQNYVNILLMLLRLRQACDHPLLVRGYDTSSFGRSSIEMAKKLPREKQVCLLKCLDASLCGICNDPPEDAVVSICGHVFCNQCICEHLTGDDNLCPMSKCKVRLNRLSVFSKATLNSSLSDQSAQDGSGSEPVDSVSAYSESSPYDSSKIRAALEVLQSLKKPQDCMSPNGVLEKSSNGDATQNLSTPVIDIDDGKNIKDSVKLLGEKAIVFSQWTRMLDLLEACLKNSSIQYRRLDGTMSVVARDKAVKDFNTLPEVSVMIMSLKAASLGLNMVAACRVLLLDLWWNPTTEDQAIDRAHRIGQTRPVTVLRLTVKNTVEDRILALQQKKREMVASAFGEDETGGRQTRLTVDDLRYLFMV